MEIFHSVFYGCMGNFYLYITILIKSCASEPIYLQQGKKEVEKVMQWAIVAPLIITDKNMT